MTADRKEEKRRNGETARTEGKYHGPGGCVAHVAKPKYVRIYSRQLKIWDRARQRMVDRGTEELMQCNCYISVYRAIRKYTK